MRTRQHYCDNVTMFSGHTIVGYCITVCLYSLWLLLFHIFFLSRKLYYVVALSRCRVSRAQLCHYICLYKYFLVRPYTIYLSLQKQNRCCDKCPVKKVPLPPGPIISWPLSSCAVWFGNILLKNGADIVFGLTFCGRRGWSINFFSHSTPHPWSRVGVGLDSCL